MACTCSRTHIARSQNEKNKNKSDFQEPFFLKLGIFYFVSFLVKLKARESHLAYTHIQTNIQCVKQYIQYNWHYHNSDFEGGPPTIKSRPSNLNLPHDKSLAWISLHRIYVHWHIEPDQRVINLPHTRWRENPTLFLSEWYSSPWPIMGEPEIQQLDTFSSEHCCTSFAQQTNWISLHLCTQKLVT